MLVGALAGGRHEEQPEYEEQRRRYLDAKGYRVPRFWNNEALTEIRSVLEAMPAPLAGPAPHPNPLPRGSGNASRRVEE